MAGGHMTLRQCLETAGDIIDSGKAMQKMLDFVAATNEAAA
jgi:hypothetical protein